MVVLGQRSGVSTVYGSYSNVYGFLGVAVVIRDLGMWTFYKQLQITFTYNICDGKQQEIPTYYTLKQRITVAKLDY